MIRSYNDHAANERTFLAWVRMGLSTVALGIVIKKGSLVAVLIAGSSSPALSGSGQDYFSDYGGLVLIGTGIATMAGAAVRLVTTALRIDDHRTHGVGILRIASALRCHKRQDSRAIERVSTKVKSAPTSKRNAFSLTRKRGDLELIAGTDLRQMH
jgi:putative membrane protein